MKRKIIGLLCMFFLIGLIVGCGEEKRWRIRKLLSSTDGE